MTTFLNYGNGSVDCRATHVYNRTVSTLSITKMIGIERVNFFADSFLDENDWSVTRYRASTKFECEELGSFTTLDDAVDYIENSFKELNEQ